MNVRVRKSNPIPTPPLILISPVSPSFQADKPKSAAAAPRPEGQVAQRHRRILGGRGLWLRLGGVQGVGGQVHAALPLAASSADTAASLEIKRWDIIVADLFYL